MTKDHQLGFPDMNKQAMQDERDARSGWTVLYLESMYPLGTPKRVKDEQRAEWYEWRDDYEGMSEEVRAFNTGDHWADGSIREGVTDDELLAGVERNMEKLKTQADLRKFYMALTDRLKPMRTRALVNKVAYAYGDNVRRIEKLDAAKQREASRFVPRETSVGPCGIAQGLSGLIRSAPSSSHFADKYAAQLPASFYPEKKLGE